MDFPPAPALCAVCLTLALAGCIPALARSTPPEAKVREQAAPRTDAGTPVPPRVVQDALVGAGRPALLPRDPELGELEDLEAGGPVRAAAASARLFLEGLKAGSVPVRSVHPDYRLMFERSIQPFLERGLRPDSWRLGRFQPADAGSFMESAIMVAGKAGSARGTIGLASIEGEWLVVSFALDFEALEGKTGRRPAPEKIEP
jgi:hypothetical protein